jgi:ribosomal protein S18
MNQKYLNVYNVTQLILKEINLLNRYLRIKPRRTTKHKQKFQKILVKFVKYSRILGNLP